MGIGDWEMGNGDWGLGVWGIRSVGGVGRVERVESFFIISPHSLTSPLPTPHSPLLQLKAHLL
ncbi:hypothetical protein H1Q63_22680 [Desmonostoc muscorum CCALA 125]|nr:hypothetical protein [Desmonostoc muscorum CCALA 125]